MMINDSNIRFAQCLACSTGGDLMAGHQRYALLMVRAYCAARHTVGQCLLRIRLGR